MRVQIVSVHEVQESTMKNVHQLMGLARAVGGTKPHEAHGHLFEKLRMDANAEKPGFFRATARAILDIWQQVLEGDRAIPPLSFSGWNPKDGLVLETVREALLRLVSAAYAKDQGSFARAVAVLVEYRFVSPQEMAQVLSGTLNLADVDFFLPKEKNERREESEAAPEAEGTGKGGVEGLLDRVRKTSAG